MPVAICIRCGSAKLGPLTSCEVCGLDPRGDAVAEVKSLCLSVARFDDSKEAAAYEAILLQKAEQLRTGIPIEYDEDEINRLLTEREVLEDVTWAVLVRFVFRLFFPGFIVLGVGLLLWALFAWLR